MSHNERPNLEGSGARREEGSVMIRIYGLLKYLLAIWKLSHFPGSILSAYSQMSLRNDEQNKSKHYQSEPNPRDDACSQVWLPSDLCDHISDILC